MRVYKSISFFAMRYVLFYSSLNSTMLFLMVFLLYLCMFEMLHKCYNTNGFTEPYRGRLDLKGSILTGFRIDFYENRRKIMKCNERYFVNGLNMRYGIR